MAEQVAVGLTYDIGQEPRFRLNKKRTTCIPMKRPFLAMQARLVWVCFSPQCSMWFTVCLRRLRRFMAPRLQSRRKYDCGPSSKRCVSKNYFCVQCKIQNSFLSICFQVVKYWNKEYSICKKKNVYGIVSFCVCAKFLASHSLPHPAG